MSIRTVPDQQIEHRVIRQLDTGSVVRVALALSLTLAGIFVVGFVALYLLGTASGALAGMESFIASLGWAEFRFRFSGVLPIVLLLGALGSALVTGIAAIFAVLYNALADLVGGIEIVVRDR